MTRKLRQRAFSFALLSLVASPIAARACAFDDGSPAAGLFDRDFFAVNAQASTVYFAITDALTQGLLERAAFQPQEAGSAGYWRAAGRITTLHRRIAAAAQQSESGRATPAMALLLIDSNLWARLTPDTRGLTLAMHATGARPGDVIVATSEVVLAAVLDGHMSVDTALGRGLIALGGAKAADAKELIAAALAAGTASPDATAPVRLFGPAR
ncbi:MAG: hypothetical protein IT537_12505 [Hyphomicrobiales bacterium]|nr:hypothetical protein [Hyphomicrobiales bacterium]